MHDISDLRGTIVPKSDQLNSEQLLSGPITITVTNVSLGSDEQPLLIHHATDPQRPFKPCKTMRKVLIFAWGEDGRHWVGKSMTLYNDERVRFGGAEVGGIRISHLSDIERDLQVSLTATKGKKALHTIRRIDPKVSASAVDHLESIESAQTTEDVRAAFRAAYKSTEDAATRAEYKAAYDARVVYLS
jgi:hypothetical protein